jgi:hypothetical protein
MEVALGDRRQNLASGLLHAATLTSKTNSRLDQILARNPETGVGDAYGI